VESGSVTFPKKLRGSALTQLSRSEKEQQAAAFPIWPCVGHLQNPCRMKISIFGIGYVGAVSAACLVKDGNQVVCVDPNPDKVNSILQKSSPILEPGLDELIVSGVDSGNLTAIGDAAEAVRRTDLSILCVGTPSRLNGSLDTGYVARAAEEVGAAIKRKVGYHSVVVRSTILPGTMEELVVPALERASGMRAGADFGVAYYPEFLRESTAIADLL
jgi:GDP-mannose 6-dehydrogenase